MSRSKLSSQACSVSRAVAQVGDEWSIVILREMFLDSRRFDDFLRQTGISSHLLSTRLKKLQADGVIRRQVYSQRPLRYEYRLTAKGRDLWPVIVALKQWGDSWLNEGDSPIRIAHKTCGHITQPAMTCAECGEVMSARDATAVLSESITHERQTAKGSQ